MFFIYRVRRIIRFVPIDGELVVTADKPPRPGEDINLKVALTVQSPLLVQSCQITFIKKFRFDEFDPVIESIVDLGDGKRIALGSSAETYIWSVTQRIPDSALEGSNRIQWDADLEIVTSPRTDASVSFTLLERPRMVVSATA